MEERRKGRRLTAAFRDLKQKMRPCESRISSLTRDRVRVLAADLLIRRLGESSSPVSKCTRRCKPRRSPPRDSPSHLPG